MSPEILSHLPKSFQLWAKIEEEAERRAEARFQEILKERERADEGTPADTNNKYSDKSTYDTIQLEA